MIYFLINDKSRYIYELLAVCNGHTHDVDWGSYVIRIYRMYKNTEGKRITKKTVVACYLKADKCGGKREM